MDMNAQAKEASHITFAKDVLGRLINEYNASQQREIMEFVRTGVEKDYASKINEAEKDLQTLMSSRDMFVNGPMLKSNEIIDGPIRNRELIG